QDLRLTIESVDDSKPLDDNAAKPVANPDSSDNGGSPTSSTARKLNTIMEMYGALRGCWVPPAPEEARPGMQISVRLSFKRSGEILGNPKITFESRGASDDERLVYRLAVAAMLKRCTPLPFTDGLGNAVAGRPFNMRLIDERKLKQAG